MRTELYFSIGPAGSSDGVAPWRDFLEKVITPRFPDGLTVLDAYGQWSEPPDQPERLHTKVVILAHVDDTTARQRLAEIRRQFCSRWKEKSVLQITTAAQVLF